MAILYRAYGALKKFFQKIPFSEILPFPEPVFWGRGGELGLASLPNIGEKLDKKVDFSQRVRRY